MKKTLYMLLAALLSILAACETNKDGETTSPGNPSETPVETAKWLSDYLSEKSSGTTAADVPVVYFTSDISPAGLMAAYEALGRTPSGRVAVKVHTGESEESNYLRPDFIKELVQLVDGTFVECNTAYGGTRAGTAMHRQLAIDHGFTAVADMDIMDADGSIALPVAVAGGGHLKGENYVGENFTDYDFFLVLSHFKGHRMGGFGGALKNISIGIASSSGKSWIHSAGANKSGFSPGPQDAFTESMAEAAKSISDALGGGERIMYINVMNNLSTICDCNAHPDNPSMHDIGILASLDPVALDQACVDLVYAAPDGRAEVNGFSMVSRIERQNGVHILEHAQAIGLGSRSYELVSIDG
jgi:uncharacterized Fe-S center protein